MLAGWRKGSLREQGEARFACMPSHTHLTSSRWNKQQARPCSISCSRCWLLAYLMEEGVVSSGFTGMGDPGRPVCDVCVVCASTGTVLHPQDTVNQSKADA